MFRKCLRVQIVLIVLLVFFSVTSCSLRDNSMLDEGSFDKNVEMVLKNPGKDVPGKDFRTIPRFPGSVRIAYQADRDQDKRLTICAYKTAADLGEVSSFFETEMARRGWVLKAKEDKLLMMVFVRRETGGLPMAQVTFMTGADGAGTVVNIVVQDQR